MDLKWITDKFMRLTRPVLKKDDQIKLVRSLSEDLDVPLQSQIAMINQMLENQ